LIIKQMDVCSDESVNKIVQEVLDAEGKIDVLCKYESLHNLCLFVLLQ